MMLIFKGIMDELPQFKKYWAHMFQNKSMPVVGECQRGLGWEDMSMHWSKNGNTSTPDELT